MEGEVWRAAGIRRDSISVLSPAVMTGHSPPVSSLNVGDRSFLGHPRGLAFLAFTEAWERFSFYGMMSLLLLYLIQRLLTPSVMGSVYGLARFRMILESVSGPMSNQSFASQIFGLYTGFVYFTPIFGGLLADRLLGQKRTVMLGAIMMSAGHVLMAFDTSFILALLLLIGGTGCLKGNISTQIGHLYAIHDDSRRTRAFAIYSVAINFGALAGPIVCGILAQAYGWHVGFAVAGLLMLLGLAGYIVGWTYLPPDVVGKHRVKVDRMSIEDWKIVIILIILSMIAIFTITAYTQERNSGLLFIETSVNRKLFGWQVPTTIFSALDGFFCILVVPFLISLWRFQAGHGREPGDLGKIAIGYFITALANLLMVIAAVQVQRGAAVTMFWPIGLYALNALGFIYYWPTLLALFSRAAPAAINSTMMGVLFFSNFIGNILVGILGGFWEKMSHPMFFGLHAALGLAAALTMLLVMKPFSRILNSGRGHSASDDTGL